MEPGSSSNIADCALLPLGGLIIALKDFFLYWKKCLQKLSKGKDILNVAAVRQWGRAQFSSPR